MHDFVTSDALVLLIFP